MSYTDIAAALLATLIMGGNVLAVKLGTDVVPPFIFLALRSFLIWPLLLVVPCPNIPWPKIIAVGFGFGVFLVGFLMIGFQMGISVGMASLLAQTGAFFVVILSAVLLKLPPKSHHVWGMVIGFVGVIYLTSQMGLEASFWGAFFVMCSAFSWALANVLVKQINTTEIIRLSVWHCSTPALPMLFAAFYVDGFDQVVLSLQNTTLIGIGTAAYSGFVMSLIGGAIWNYLTIKYNPAQVAPFVLFVPLFGLFFGWLILDEVLHTYVLFGGILVMLGLAINQGIIRLPFLKTT